MTEIDLPKLSGDKAAQRVRRELPPREALEAAVRAWFKYVPVVFNVAHALQAAAASDPDARQAWESRMRLLRGGLLTVMQRLHADGGMARGWSPETATDWCYHLVHIDTWQHLVVERQWKPADVVQRTVSTLQAVLGRPDNSP